LLKGIQIVRSMSPAEFPLEHRCGRFPQSSGVQKKLQHDAGGKRNMLAACLRPIMPGSTRR
jgi:hypothetical protein